MASRAIVVRSARPGRWSPGLPTAPVGRRWANSSFRPGPKGSRPRRREEYTVMNVTPAVRGRGGGRPVGDRVGESGGLVGPQDPPSPGVTPPAPHRPLRRAPRKARRQEDGDSAEEVPGSRCLFSCLPGGDPRRRKSGENHTMVRGRDYCHRHGLASRRQCSCQYRFNPVQQGHFGVPGHRPLVPVRDHHIHPADHGAVPADGRDQPGRVWRCRHSRPGRGIELWSVPASAGPASTLGVSMVPSSTGCGLISPSFANQPAGLPRVQSSSARAPSPCRPATWCGPTCSTGRPTR